MKNDNIIALLKEWFNIMLKKYEGLSFKYEYSEKRKVYLVSYNASDDLLDDDAFCCDIIDFENEMNNEWGIYAPLFCENESLFELCPYSNSVSKFGLTENFNNWEWSNFSFKEIKNPLNSNYQYILLAA